MSSRLKVTSEQRKFLLWIYKRVLDKDYDTDVGWYIKRVLTRGYNESDRTDLNEMREWFKAEYKLNKR